MKCQYIILLIVIPLYECSNLNCGDMYSEALPEEVECYPTDDIFSDFGDDSVCNENRNITWNIVDSTHGKLMIVFDLFPSYCNHTNYLLKLHVDESLSGKHECHDSYSIVEDSRRFQQIPVHSVRYVNLAHSQNLNGRNIASCNDSVTVTFNYIFTGCYYIEVKAEENRAPVHVENSGPKYLETRYKKDLLTNKKLTIASQIISNQNLGVGIQLESIGNLYMTFRLSDEINTSLGDRACYESGYEHSCCNYMPSGEFMCRLKGEKERHFMCAVGKDEISCTIPNVTSGYYCILVEVHDDRCEKSIVWRNTKYGCLFNTPIINVTALLPASPLVPTSQSETSWQVIASIFSVLVVICLCILVYILRKKRPPPPGISALIETEPLSLRPRILLLYSRDCIQFMRVMAAFREMLKDMMKCEIYDCFDPDLMEEVGRSKAEWIRRHLSCPEVKVIVFETECSVIRQKAQLEQLNINYIEPMWLDDIFIYGLKALTDDLDKNMYQRVFVVRVNGFIEDKYQLSYLIPYTRYVIPQHLEGLLSSFYQRSALEHVLYVDENADSIRRLQEDITNLGNYKKKNPKYLDSLLKRRV